MTTVYISRHSTPFKEHRGIELINENKLTWNKMSPLSVNGEKRAEKLSELKCLQNIDVVWSSEYVRAMSTAKYIAHKNDISVNIDERLGERIHGDLTDYTDMDDYHYRQYTDVNYKLDNGENQLEVRNRMLECLYEIIENNKDKNIFICSHQVAMTFFLMNWCKLNIETYELTYNNKEVFDMNFKTPELFKLVFDSNNELITIENIKRIENVLNNE